MQRHIAAEHRRRPVARIVVAERADGVVIRGARLLATLGPIADELLVFPSTVLRGTADEFDQRLPFATGAFGLATIT